MTWRRCTEDGCGSSAVGATGLCIRHGGGRRCAEDGCQKLARHATSLCVTHGGGRRCAKEGCGRSAVGATGLCVRHGGGRRCAEVDAHMLGDGEVAPLSFALPERGPLCLDCVRRLYPMQGSGPRKRYARREHLVLAELETRLCDTLGSVDLVHQSWDCPIPCGSSRRRPDYYLEFDRFIVIVEVDEEAHRTYDPEDEMLRLHQLRIDCPVDKALLVVRINTGPYSAYPSMFRKKRRLSGDPYYEGRGEEFERRMLVATEAIRAGVRRGVEEGEGSAHPSAEVFETLPLFYQRSTRPPMQRTSLTSDTKNFPDPSLKSNKVVRMEMKVIIDQSVQSHFVWPECATTFRLVRVDNLFSFGQSGQPLTQGRNLQLKKLP